jgi:hypothetical protein
LLFLQAVHINVRLGSAKMGRHGCEDLRFEDEVADVNLIAVGPFEFGGQALRAAQIFWRNRQDSLSVNE